jgi:hypothetical protein
VSLPLLLIGRVQLLSLRPTHRPFLYKIIFTTENIGNLSSLIL